jgi:hypothetical protein
MGFPSPRQLSQRRWWKTGGSDQLPAQRLVNAVLGDVEEPTFAARCPNLSCSLGAFRCVIYQRSNVDHRNTGKLAEAHSEERVVLMFRGFLGFAPHAQEVASP